MRAYLTYFGARASVLFFAAIVALDMAGAQDPTAHDIVDRAERVLWGRTLAAQLTMTVRTPRWERSLTLQSWMDRPSRTFIRILAPSKEAGIASLRIGAEMWNYLPTVERSIKIPPSMMLQPWMGSDFTNDDLVKESSMVDDYTHRIIGADTAGVPAFIVEAIPKPDAAVVWGKVLFRIRKADFLPVRLDFFDERGTVVRVLTYSEIKPIGGRSIPTKWEMRPVAKPGNLTTIVLERARFDEPISAEVFTQRNLTKR
ncbi:MAG: outer membrane lipoprotein-sorting protein [Gemmatimonadaceae bacterium]